MTQNPVSLTVLVDDFNAHLRALGRSPQTIRCYMRTMKALTGALSQDVTTDTRSVKPRHLTGFLADRQERYAPGSVVKDYDVLNVFFSWLVTQDEINERKNPMLKVERVKSKEQPVTIIPDSDILALLAVCKGSGLRQRRDTAILRVLLDTGMRAGEVAGIRLDDVDFSLRKVRVLGKGGKYRDVPFGAKTEDALRRYLRVRDRSTHASKTDALWIGQFGPLTSFGVWDVVNRRTKQAGIGHLYPHQFRHTFAHHWLDNGGEEGDLMRICGWTTRTMLDRYGRAGAVNRAHKAHRRLSPGDRI